MPSVHTSRMHLTRRLTLAGILIALPSICAAGGQTEPLADPIPATIEKGDLVVGAEEFVRVPRTSDSSEGGQTNPAYARIQFLVPIGDGSGRLVVNDLRGPLYVTDERGMTPGTFLDLRKEKLLLAGTFLGNLRFRTTSRLHF